MHQRCQSVDACMQKSCLFPEVLISEFSVYIFQSDEMAGSTFCITRILYLPFQVKTQMPLITQWECRYLLVDKLLLHSTIPPLGLSLHIHLISRLQADPSLGVGLPQTMLVLAEVCAPTAIIVAYTLSQELCTTHLFPNPQNSLP